MSIADGADYIYKSFYNWDNVPAGTCDLRYWTQESFRTYTKKGLLLDENYIEIRSYYTLIAKFFPLTGTQEVYYRYKGGSRTTQRVIHAICSRFNMSTTTWDSLMEG